MKKLVIPALLAGVAMGASGCIFVSDDSDDGTLDVSWTLYDRLGDDEQQVVPCPAEVTTAAVHVETPGGGEVAVDLFDCAAGGGLVTDLPHGNHVVWIDFTDDSGVDLYAQSEAATLDIGVGSGADFDVDVYNGFWDVSWEITNGSCAETNGVSVVSTQDGTAALFDSIYDCEAGLAPAIVTTDPVPVGDYVVVASALDQDDLSIGDSEPVNASISHGHEFVDLGVLSITLL